MPKMLLLSEAVNQSLIQDRTEILWRELQPFCVDHILLLESLESPLWLGGNITIKDVQTAVLACSTGSMIEFFDATLRPAYGLRLWKKITRIYHDDLRKIERDWKNYVSSYAPKFERMHAKDSEPSKMPGYILTAARLVQHGVAPATARRMGLGEMTVWALAILENNPTPECPDPLKFIKDDWDVQTALEIAEMEAEQNGR